MTKQNEAAVLAKLREKCAGRGGQAAFAKEHGFSRNHISDVLKGDRAVTERLANALGYKKISGFVENA